MGKSSLLQMDDEVLDDADEGSTVELIVSDFGEPTGEMPATKQHKKNPEDSTYDQKSMTIDGTKVSIGESNDEDYHSPAETKKATAAPQQQA